MSLSKQLFLLCTTLLAFFLAPTPAFAQAVSAESGVVLTVQASSVKREARWNESSGTAVGAALGGLAGYKASDYNKRYAASAVGGLVGAALGRSFDGRRQSGFDVVIQLDNGRTIAVFDRDPHVRPGDRVFLLGNDRIIPAAAQRIAAE